MLNRLKKDKQNLEIYWGVITNVTDDCLYEIGTRTGNLKQKYTRGEVIPAKNIFMNAQDVPEVGVRHERLLEKM